MRNDLITMNTTTLLSGGFLPGAGTLAFGEKTLGSGGSNIVLKRMFFRLDFSINGVSVL